MCLLAVAARAGEPVAAEVRVHRGRPMVFIDGEPNPLPTYNPRDWEREAFKKTVGRFFQHDMAAYILSISRAKGEKGHWTSRFWRGDRISSTPLAEAFFSVDEQAEHVLRHDPDAFLIVRFSVVAPTSWQELHPGELVVTEGGKRLGVVSLASEAFNDAARRFCAAVVQYCESRRWSSRLIGYANFTVREGTHPPLTEHLLFDHSPVMLARWRAFLKRKYRTREALRKAHRDQAITFENVMVPSDRLRGAVPDVSARLYWQNARDNQPLRDYLELTRDLFHRQFRAMTEGAGVATDRKRFYLYDSLKLSMLGWSNFGFFNPTYSWQLAYASDRAGSGHMNVSRLMSGPGFDGLITPHDYQARGVGGVYEPEGSVDSVVLRGKYFLCEMDTRTYCQPDSDRYGSARDAKEFAAITWRNVATGLTRGFNSYLFDLCADWYATDEIHEVIARQVAVIRLSAQWPHETVPGIAMILDDTAVLETNGAGNFFNEAVLWEWKMGLARCGVPYRIYLLDDLELDGFPEHRVFYFPNLFRVDDQRMALLSRKVFRNGHVVVWGPGSGISDGREVWPVDANGNSVEGVTPQSPSRLTGFAFHPLILSNYPRRTLITNFDHPVTMGLPASTVIGGPLPYGPLLFPRDGVSLGLAWTKMGRNLSGLSVKTLGKGARGAHRRREPLGEGDWASVFTTAVPIPAAIWRNLARYAGAHVYAETDDVVMADRSVVALHSIQSGEKSIRLPGKFRVTDLVTGRAHAERSDEIRFVLDAPGTRVFLLTKP